MTNAFAVSGKWDKRFMALAHYIAEWSKESGRRVGAVVVGPDREVRSTEFNGFPRGVADDVPERHARHTGAKYTWSSHAERNAIYNAARIGIALKGCTMYVPWFPCIECSKAIIQSGIARLVAYEPSDSDERWASEFRVAKQMFAESAIIVNMMEKLKELPNGEGSGDLRFDAEGIRQDGNGK